MQLADELRIGVQPVDAEHAQLMRLIAAFGHMLRGARPKSDVLEALEALASRIDRHMANEEALLRQYRYPHLRRHMKAHQSLRENIRSIGDFLETNALNPFTGDFIASASSSWIEKHIRTYDRDFGAYMKSVESRNTCVALPLSAK